MVCNSKELAIVDLWIFLTLQPLNVPRSSEEIVLDRYILQRKEMLKMFLWISLLTETCEPTS